VAPTPEQRNYAEIDRLEGLLTALRAESSTARETEAIREIGLEIALAVREVGAMLTNVGWEQAFPSDRPKSPPPPDGSNNRAH
jgi:hypothetical protein